MLKYSQNNYALTCLSISLKHIILDNWVSFSVDRRLEIRNGLSVMSEGIRRLASQLYS